MAGTPIYAMIPKVVVKLAKSLAGAISRLRPSLRRPK